MIFFVNVTNRSTRSAHVVSLVAVRVLFVYCASTWVSYAVFFTYLILIISSTDGQPAARGPHSNVFNLRSSSGMKGSSVGLCFTSHA